MAVTITAQAAAHSPAYRPMIFECSSDRDSSLTYTVTAVSSGAGGNARLAIASTTGLNVGDVVTLTGFTTVAYNRRANVTVVSGAYIEVDFAYSVNDSGSAERTNDTFQVRADLYVFDTETPASIIAASNGGVGVTTLQLSAVHAYQVGDMVQVRAALYNGAYEIIAIGAPDEIDISIAYSATTTGTVQLGTNTGTIRQSAITVSGVDKYRFNFANLLQASVSYDLFDSLPSAAQSASQQSSKPYIVKFTEEFDDADGLVTEGDYVVNTLQKYAINATLQHQETQNLNAYFMTDSSTKFLTDAPRTGMPIQLEEEYQLSILGAINTSYKFRYERFDVNGTSFGAASSGAFTITDDRVTICINGTNALQSGTAYFDVWMINNAGTQLSEKFRFNVVSQCGPKYHRFFWLNRKGGMDAYTFNGAYKCEPGTKRTEFAKQLPSSFVVKDRGQSWLAVDTTRKHTINSGFVTSAFATWLQTCNDSPVVFLREGKGSQPFVPVVVTNDMKATEDSHGEMLQPEIEYFKTEEILQTN